MNAKRFTPAEVSRHPKCVMWVRSRDVKALEDKRDDLEMKLGVSRDLLKIVMEPFSHISDENLLFDWQREARSFLNNQSSTSTAKPDASAS